MTHRVFLGGPIFDGDALHVGAALEVASGRVARLHARAADARQDVARVDLGGDLVVPGFVDLQVNGGGGVLVGAAPDALARTCAAHRRLGTTCLLPTLITASPRTTEAVIAEALRGAIPGLAGLHLEGPHLDPRKAGAHDPALIRPMTADDLALYRAAAQRLRLKITLAPEGATEAQVAALAEAGATVFLGHSACDAGTAARYFAAGARGVTHLWNAMSPMTARAPGLVGAALEAGVACGVIADGLHVHPHTLRASLAAAQGPVFLVSDAMACAGTDLDRFALGGREVLRRDGALRLADGTLAGADLDLRRAVQVLVAELDVPLARALAMATSVPADVMGLPAGRLGPGAPAELVRLSPDLARLSVP
jgi:N-acetylglucosamine-6-phosphate deacetylase